MKAKKQNCPYMDINFLFQCSKNLAKSNGQPSSDGMINSYSSRILQKALCMESCDFTNALPLKYFGKFFSLPAIRHRTSVSRACVQFILPPNDTDGGWTVA